MWHHWPLDYSGLLYPTIHINDPPFEGTFCPPLSRSSCWTLNLSSNLAGISKTSNSFRVSLVFAFLVSGNLERKVIRKITGKSSILRHRSGQVSQKRDGSFLLSQKWSSSSLLGKVPGFLRLRNPWKLICLITDALALVHNYESGRRFLGNPWARVCIDGHPVMVGEVDMLLWIGCADVFGIFLLTCCWGACRDHGWSRWFRYLRWQAWEDKLIQQVWEKQWWCWHAVDQSRKKLHRYIAYFPSIYNT